MYYPFFSSLRSEALILTANRRLAQTLKQTFDHYSSEKQTSWESANILPLKTWLIQQWENQLDTAETCLSDEEASLLWRHIIQQDADNSALLQLNQTSRLVKQAWENQQLWQIDPKILTHHLKPETQQLLHWSQTFQMLKQQKQVITWVDIPQRLITRLESLKFPPTITLAGFNDAPPLLRHFFNIIAKHSKVDYLKPESINQTQAVIALKNSEQEVRAMAKWAKQQHEQGNKRIICVVPDLEQRRHVVSQIFCETLTSEGKLPGLDRHQLPYNISAGEKFYHLPLISSALTTLSLASKHMSIDKLRACLLSSYINSHPDERCLAAMAELEIAMLQNPDGLQIHRILSQLTNNLYPQTTLAKRWKQFYEQLQTETRQCFKSWSQHISQLLQAIGWPGQGVLNSHEYQIIERWQSLLKDFSQLDRLLPPVSQKKAFELFQYLCQQITFQAKAEDKPIQILGLLEAIGIACDQMWIMGLSDACWPPQASPNPFLPIEIQRQYAMPNASAAQTLQYAQQLQQSLTHATKNLTISYPIQSGDQALQASPLIKKISQKTCNGDLTVTNWSIAKKEQLIDDNAPPIQQKERLHGGSHILKLQAQCPFQAFSYVRLGTKHSQSASLGISPIDHGIICHQVLEIFWKRVKSQQTLLALSDHEEKRMIDDCIDKACHARHLVRNHFLAIEKKQLRRLVTQWLALEKQRPPFRVLEHETTRHIQLDKLPLKIQIDRIDETADGQHLIIDYKTGTQNNIKKWLDSRLTEPQLPLYSLFGSDKSIGLAYAEVNLSSLRFKGLIDNDNGFSEVKPLSTYLKGQFNWQELSEQWRKRIEETTRAFCEGDAAVNPCDQQVCQQCQLQPLCRIHANENTNEN